MIKEEYFKEKHEQIALQFNVRVKTIALLRSFALGQKMTRAQIILWIQDKIAKTRTHKPCKQCQGTGKVFGETNPKIEHAQALELVEKANEADWKDIVYPYEFKN